MYGGLTCEEQKHRVPLGVNGLITQEKGGNLRDGKLTKNEIVTSYNKKTKSLGSVAALSFLINTNTLLDETVTR